MATDSPPCSPPCASHAVGQWRLRLAFLSGSLTPLAASTCWLQYLVYWGSGLASALSRATHPHRTSPYFWRKLDCGEVALIWRDPPTSRVCDSSEARVSLHLPAVATACFRSGPFPLLWKPSATGVPPLRGQRRARLTLLPWCVASALRFPLRCGDSLSAALDQ